MRRWMALCSFYKHSLSLPRARRMGFVRDDLEVFAADFRRCSDLSGPEREKVNLKELQNY